MEIKSSNLIAIHFSEPATKGHILTLVISEKLRFRMGSLKG